MTWCMAEVGQKGSEEIIWGDTTVDKGHLVLGFFCFFFERCVARCGVIIL